MTLFDTPAATELQTAINRKIEEHGEVVCIQRLVNEDCTLRVETAYRLLKVCAPIWGYQVDRMPCKTGGFVLRIQRL